MTVYFDTARIRFRNMRMSHMIADTDEELLAMADKIGVQRKWHQKPPEHRFSHFDISDGKCSLALQYGAVQVSQYDLSFMLYVRERFGGKLCDPKNAKRLFNLVQDVRDL